MRFAAAFAALLLAGCVSMGEDDYAFRVKEVDRDSVVVSKREYSSLDELKRAAPKGVRNRWNEAGVGEAAWSELFPDGSCRVHVVDPHIDWRPVWLGHELAHCFWGRWHP